MGSSGCAQEVIWLVERINNINATWEILGYTEINEKPNTVINGYPVLGDDGWFMNNKNNDIYAVCCIGSSVLRKAVINKLPRQLKFATLIDPTVYISKKSNILINEGSMIGCGTILTVNIKIGFHVIINNNCTISHGSRIEDYCTLSPSVSLSGNTVLEECVELGVGVKTVQNVKISNNTLVGAGAIVIKDLPANCMAIGCPAEKVKERT